MEECYKGDKEKPHGIQGKKLLLMERTGEASIEESLFR
jgi:hypothetical protein